MLGGELEPTVAAAAIGDHFAFTIARQETHPLAGRVWELRHRFTSYDACYLALAEALDVALYTCDARLAGSGHGAEVRIVPTTH